MPEGPHKKRPRDASQLAKLIVDIASGEVEDKPESTIDKDPAAVERGKKGGKKGGRARAAKLSPEERSEIARKAAAKRWST
jgi:hypothetical protein